MSALTYQDVLDILRLIDSGSFSDFQIEFEGTKVKVTRPTGPASTGAEPETGQSLARPAERTKTPVAAPRDVKPRVDKKRDSAPESPGPRPPVDFSNSVDVKPPMAGTYYCAPSPGAPPYVEVNSTVKSGDQLGMVEVMKLFTPVLSPCDGIVRLILVGNEELVQGDQTLMIIEAAL